MITFGGLTCKEADSLTPFPEGQAAGQYVTTADGDVWQGPASPITTGTVTLNAHGTLAELAAFWNAQGTTAALAWGITTTITASSARLLRVSSPQNLHPSAIWRWSMEYRIEGTITT